MEAIKSVWLLCWALEKGYRVVRQADGQWVLDAGDFWGYVGVEEILRANLLGFVVWGLVDGGVRLSLTARGREFAKVAEVNERALYPAGQA